MTQIHKQLQMLLGSPRDKSETGELLESSVAYTQLGVGLITPILSQNTSSDFLQYTKRTWIDSIKESLQQIRGHIILPNHWTPQLQRRHDSPIMKNLLITYPIYYTDKNGNPPHMSKQNKQLIKLLNRCRLYLQIITVSGMNNLQGQAVSINFLKGYRDLNQSSKWTCTQQQRPNNKFWSIGGKSIRNNLLIPGTLTLQQSLGEYTTDYNNTPQI